MRKDARSPKQRAWDKLEQKELRWLQAHENREESRLNTLLEDKVPEKVQSSLEKGFSKAFAMIFEKGSGVIEKTFDKEELEKRYQINEYADSVRKTRASMNVFSRQAAGMGKKNLLISGAAGIGMGVFGIGIPDIPVFTSLIFRCIYEIALSYGFDYSSEGEKYFILMLIQTSVSNGENARRCNQLVNEYCDTEVLPDDYSQEKLIQETAACLSKELLYMKFLQGIPIVGAVGGAYDLKYLGMIENYANLKYHRRFLNKKI